MSDFNGKKKPDLKPKVKAQPPQYWEESSFMIAVQKGSGYPLDNIFDRIASVRGIKLIEAKLDDDKSSGSVSFSFDGDEFVLRFFYGEFSCPDPSEMFGQHLSENELGHLREAEYALTTAMDFHGSAQKCYLVQLKLISAMMPSLAAVLDESAEKILSPGFVKMAASSDVPPSPEVLYSVQAVSDENSDEVWLHTHGLCRCGIPELEILQSDSASCSGHYDLMKVVAGYMLSRDNSEDLSQPMFVGRLSDGTPIVVTLLPWEQGIWEYGRLNLGCLRDREESHNSFSSIIFLYTCEEDEQQEKRRKVDIYNSLWDDNPMYYLSNAETERMMAAARERFDYLKKFGLSPEGNAIVKIGLDADEKYFGEGNENREHIWFELKGFEPDGSFRATLTQEPYYVSDLHEGDEGVFTVNDVTDWRVYFRGDMINPDNAYLLEQE